MDNFEQYYVPQKVPAQKASPFADSPYECAVPEQEQKPKKVRKKTVWGKRLLAVLCATVIVVVCCGITAALVSHTYEKNMDQLRLETQQKLAALEQRIEDKQQIQQIIGQPVTEGLTPGQIYNQNAAAVVRIEAYNNTADGTATGSSGSGFVISPDGYVVTNCHVISGMSQVNVHIAGQDELPAQVIGVDSDLDVALLKVEGENLPCVQLGSSDVMEVGEQVVAIGYPLGSSSASLTVGYVSAKDQVFTSGGSTSTMLQTDAAINSGNSGGPLFNGAGQVIGITTAKLSGYSASGASIEGVGLAIPMDDAADVLSDLKEFGYTRSAYLGIYVMDVDAYVQAYGLPAGAFIDDVVEGLSAERAGIRKGDVIVELGGYKVGSLADLTSALRRFDPGDEVVVTLWRNGEQVKVTAVLDEKPREETQEQQGAQQPQQTVPEAEMPENWEDFFSFFENFPGFGG